MRWRFAAYSPHSAWDLPQKEEIANAFAGYHVLGLSGTKRKRHREDPACCKSKVGTFDIYEWGHSGKSEHAAGVALYLCKQVFRECNVQRIFDIPSEYQGRMGSKEVIVIFALSWHTLGCIDKRWLTKLASTVFGNMLTRLYQNYLIAVFLSFLQIQMQRMGYVVLSIVCFGLLGLLLLVYIHWTWKL